MTDHLSYRDHRIRPVSYQLAAGGWVPKADVYWDDGPAIQFHEILSSNPSLTFPTEAEADRHALELAKTWIDEQR